MFSLPIFALLMLTLSMCYTIQIMNFAFSCYTQR